MSTNQFRVLRGSIIAMQILLFLQFELGMTVNMSDPPAIPPFAFSLPQVLDAINGVGVVARLHAGLGVILLLLAVVILLLSLPSGIRRVQVYGVLAFLTIAVAAGGGLFFVLSGFQDNHSGHAMATNFIVSFALYFLELYALKPGAAASTSADPVA